MAERDGAELSGECPECGAPLSASFQGLCAVCLLGETPATSGRETPHGIAAIRAGGVGPALMQLPGYRLSREIARGGMGIIYEAIQRNPSRTVAIKMLLPHLMDQPAMRERFRREAQAMSGLDHAGILPVYEVGDYNGLPYFSMKLAAGGTLGGQAWRFRGNWRAIAELMATLSDAIQVAHTHGVLHRDLKPENILFDEQNRPYLSDFGIAKQISDNAGPLDLTKTATLLGTPNYLPPEWAAGTARGPTTAGDIYGLGAIFYQLLTGDPPHRAAHLTTLLRKIADDPVEEPRAVDPSIPRDLEVICLKCLSKEPASRYPAAQDLAEDLRLWLEGRPIRARAISDAERMWRWAQRNPLTALLAVLLAGALLFGSIGLGVAFRDSRRNLHHALVAQARALRETGRLVDRGPVMVALEQARALQPSPEVQVEMSSALAMVDYKPMHGIRHGEGGRVKMDASLSRFFSLDKKGRMSVVGLADGKEISAIPGDLTDPESFGPFSPDGRFVMIRPIRTQPFSIWDCQTHQFVRRGEPGTSAVFGPDSRTLAIGSEHGQVIFKDTLTGAVHAVFKLADGPVRPYCYSPDGTLLMVGIRGTPQFIVLDCSSGKPVLEAEHPAAAKVRCAAWKPDGTGVFIGTEAFIIYEWTLLPNSLPRQYVGHHGNIQGLGVHPGGEWLVSQSEDHTTRIWDVASGRAIAQLPYLGSEVQFSADGSSFYCEDREAHSLQMVSLNRSPVCRQFFIPHPEVERIGTRGCWAVTFSPDGGLLSVGDTAGIFHFHGVTGVPLGQFQTGYSWGLGWTKDGSALYSVSDQGLQQWKVQSSGTGPEGGGKANIPKRTLEPPVRWMEPVPEPDRKDNLRNMGISGDGRWLAQAYRRGLQLFSVPDGNPAELLAVDQAKIDAVALNYDGSLAATSLSNGTGVPVWRTGGAQVLRTLDTGYKESSVRFYPDEPSVLIGDRESLTCLEKGGANTRWRICLKERSPVTVVTAFTPDGSLIASNLSADTISLLDPRDGREITSLRHPSPHPVSGLAFSSDHSRLAVLCIGHVVQIWDLRRLREELAGRDLDWKHPPFPAEATPALWEVPDWRPEETGD